MGRRTARRHSGAARVVPSSAALSLSLAPTAGRRTVRPAGRPARLAYHRAAGAARVVAALLVVASLSAVSVTRAPHTTRSRAPRRASHLDIWREWAGPSVEQAHTRASLTHSQSLPDSPTHSPTQTQRVQRAGNTHTLYTNTLVTAYTRDTYPSTPTHYNPDIISSTSVITHAHQTHPQG